VIAAPGAAPPLSRGDCFAVGDAVLTVAEAEALIGARVHPVAGVETVPLAAARGRVLAEALVADRLVPPHDNAALDGWAVHADDLDPVHGAVLPVGGRAAAGHPSDRPARRGEATRVFTGAPLPVGADGTQASGPDTVVMQEDCTVLGDGPERRVRLPGGVRRGANRRAAGEDLRPGQVVLGAGQRLRPQDLAVAAALGRTALVLRRRLTAAVFSTGDELRAPGAALAPGTVYDSNRTMAIALLEGLGVVVDDLGILPDDASAIAGAVAAAGRRHDLVLTSGGMSAGEEDHVGAAVLRHGRLHAWRLAIKPGRPVALGQVGEAAFIGLPGNPVSAMVTFLVLARPLVLRLAGAAPVPARRYRVVAGFSHAKKPGRREFLRAWLEDGTGGPVARRYARDGAGILSSLVAAEGLVELAEPTAYLSEGDAVAFLPFSEVLG